MNEDAQAEIDRIIVELHDLEEGIGSSTAAGGLLHGARTILQEVVRLTAFGGKQIDDDPA